jgi:hypothetical protein
MGACWLKGGGNSIAKRVARLSRERYHLLTRNRGKTAKKIINGFARFEVVEQSLHGNSCSVENEGPPSPRGFARQLAASSRQTTPRRCREATMRPNLTAAPQNHAPDSQIVAENRVRQARRRRQAELASLAQKLAALG